MTNKSARLSIILLLSMFLMVYYNLVILNPNTYLFTTYGDSVKNYYTFASYISNNDSYLEFTQMNYPYGESIFYTDSQLAIALPFKLVCELFPSLSNYAFGYLNSLLLLSIFLCALILFEIFNLLKLPKVLSVLSALGICLLSPQMLRLDGHFSLAYSFFIPLSILYVLKVSKSFKVSHFKYGLIFLSAFFLHAYLGLMCAGVVGLYFGINLLINITKKERVISNLKSLLVGLVPLLIFYFSAKLLDNHTGRTDNPWGIFNFYATVESIFLPYSGFLSDFSNQLLKPGIIEKETVGYVGFSTVLGLSAFIILLIVSPFLKVKARLYEGIKQNKSLIGIAAVGVVFLLVSMLYPFRWGLESWLDDLKIIRQFRAIGRFSWPFYYISTIITIYIIGQFALYLENVKGKRELAYLIMFLFPGLMMAESFDYHHYNEEDRPAEKNIFKQEFISEDLQEVLNAVPDYSEYQAFIPLPFFLVGSENFQCYRGDLDNKPAFQFNYFTKVPMIANMSARSSIWEAKRMMQLFSQPYYEQEIKSDFKSDKPLLVLFHKSSVSSEEYRILNLSERIVENPTYFLGKIHLKDIFKSTHEEIWEEYLAIKDQLYPKFGFLVSDTNALLKYHDFGVEKPIIFDSHENSYQMKTEEMITLGTIETNEGKLGKSYMVSFWVYNDGENYGQDQPSGHFFYDKIFDQKSHWFGFKRPGESFQINESWSMLESEVYFTEPIAQHLILYKRDLSLDITPYLKDMIVYEKGMKVYKEIEIDGKPYLFFNNNRVPKFKEEEK